MASVEVVTLTREQIGELLAEAAEAGARRAIASLAPKPEPPRQLVTLAAAAAALAVSPKTISRRIKSGVVSPETLKPLRFDLDVLRRQLSEGS